MVRETDRERYKYQVWENTEEVRKDYVHFEKWGKSHHLINKGIVV